MSAPRAGATDVEAWLAGPVEGIPPLLMPVAHALVQSQKDLRSAASSLSAETLWHRPGGAASIGFHLRHIAGSIDRLLTYARGEALTDVQFAAMREESSVAHQRAGAAELLDDVDAAVELVLKTLRRTSPDELLAPREVGRARRPSNVLGLLFHIAEHTQRHTGQVITTARIMEGAS